MDISPRDEKVESAFNMGIETLKRINESLIGCKFARHSILYSEWYKHLLDLYVETFFLLSITEREDVSGKLNDCGKIVSSAGQNNQNINAHVMSEKLIECEVIMREAIKGLLIPKKDDPRFAVLKR